MGLSSSKTKTQSTTTSSPLDQYAPYINRGLASAQTLLDGNQGNLANMSQSAYGLYNDLAKSIGADGGFTGNARNAAANIYGGAYMGANPGASTYKGLMSANDPSLGILSGLAQGSHSPGAYDRIGDDNPALGLFSGMTAQHPNSDSTQFYKDTLSGKYLNANPYLDVITKQSDDAVTRALNQRFGAAGMGSGLSTAYADLLSHNLADSENKLRYGAYNDELARMTTIGAQSDAEYNATQDRSLNATTGLGNLYNQTGQLKLSAQQARDQAFQADRAAQLAAAQALGQQQNADSSTAINAASAADTQYNQQIAHQLQALGLVQDLTNAQYAGVPPALSALQAAASIPYTGVNNYSALVSGLTGKYGTSTEDKTEKTSGNIGQAFVGALGSGLGQALSGGLADWLKLPPLRS